jgi:hypothetical protein
VVACLRVITNRKVGREVRGFPTTTQGLLALAEWLENAGCTHVAMEATGVYWNTPWYGRGVLRCGISIWPMSANGMVRPCSGLASKRSWQGAPKTRSTPCHTSSMLESP